MSMRPVPKTWEEFQEYWNRVCRDELEINQATLDIFQIRIPKPKFVLMPTPLWDQMFKPLVAGQRWIAAGLFDPAVREKAGMRWTAGDEVLLRLFGKAVEVAFLVVPDEIRLAPARADRIQAGGRKTARRCAARGGAGVHGARRVTGAGCPCTTSPAARPSSNAPGALVHTTFSLAGLRPAGGARPRRLDQSPRLRAGAQVQADRRGRGHVEAFRVARHRDDAPAGRPARRPRPAARAPPAPNTHAVGALSSGSASSSVVSPSTVVAKTCNPAAAERRSTAAAGSAARPPAQRTRCPRRRAGTWRCTGRRCGRPGPPPRPPSRATTGSTCRRFRVPRCRPRRRSAAAAGEDVVPA